MQRLYVDSGSIGINSRNQIVGGAAVYFYNTPYMGTIAKTAIITEGIDHWTTSKLHLCTNGDPDLSTQASIANARLTVMPWGAVGINNTSPLATLDVTGSFRVLSSAYAALGSGTGIDIIYSGGGTLSCGTRGSGGVLTAATMGYAASAHTFYTGTNAATNAMTINSSGQVGIGIANPTASLHVTGKTLFSDIDIFKQADVSVRRVNDASFAIVAGRETDKSILYFGTPLYSGTTAGAYKCAIIAVGSGSGYGWSTNDLHFCLNSSTGQTPTDTNTSAFSATVADSRMVIKTNGYVGIGTHTPVGMLQVGHSDPTGATSDGNIVIGKMSNGYRYFKMGFDADFSFCIGDYGIPNALVWVRAFKIVYSAPADSLVIDSAGVTSVKSLKMNAGGSAFQIARGKIAGGTGSGSVMFPFTFTNIPSVCCTFETASTTQIFSAGVSGVTTTGFNYVKTWNQTSGAAGGSATGEPVFWIAIG